MPFSDSPDLRPSRGTSRWEHFPHGADVGIRGIGASPAAAFEQGALVRGRIHVMLVELDAYR